MTAATRLAALLALLAGPASSQEIEVGDAFVYAARPGAPAAAAYMTIANPGGKPDRLLSAASPVAAEAQLHESVTDADGVARMVPRPDGIAVPAGGEVALARGGLHVMLMGLDGALAEGDIVPLTLVFEVAGEVLVEAPVSTDPAAGLAAHDNGHGG